MHKSIFIKCTHSQSWKCRGKKHLHICTIRRMSWEILVPYVHVWFIAAQCDKFIWSKNYLVLFYIASYRNVSFRIVSLVICRAYSSWPRETQKCVGAYMHTPRARVCVCVQMRMCATSRASKYHFKLKHELCSSIYLHFELRVKQENPFGGMLICYIVDKLIWEWINWKDSRVGAEFAKARNQTQLITMTLLKQR